MKSKETLTTVACGVFLEALRDYIDCGLEEVIASHEVGADGYTSTPVTERKAREKAWEALESASSMAFAKATLDLEGGPDSFERDLLDKG